MTALEAIEKPRRHDCSLDRLHAVVAAGYVGLACRYACDAEAADPMQLEPLILASTRPQPICDCGVIASDRGLNLARRQDAIIHSGDGTDDPVGCRRARRRHRSVRRCDQRAPGSGYAFLFEIEMRQKARY